ncbi:OsmC family protein [Bacillus piscicola]|uniref:OsmC family protein n=1 Tax=Bacillus piscicola TaxID=1632684 RepID=UPI001F09B375|nr:OsmC family protein [Bacillus piscicola]
MEFFMEENGFSTKTGFGDLQISGEDEHGFRPYQLMVSSLAVCSGVTLRKIMEKRRQPVKNIHMKAEVTRNEEGSREIQKIHIHFVVEAEGVTEAQMQKNLDWTHRNCSMVQSVKDSIEVTETFAFKTL